MVMISMLLQSFFVHFADSFKREEGQDFAEYAIILALVVIVGAAAFGPLGGAIAAAVAAVTGALAP